MASSASHQVPMVLLLYYSHGLTRHLGDGAELHSFTHKAHRVFYRVNEPAKTVEIVTVLHGAMRPDLHLKS